MKTINTFPKQGWLPDLPDHRDHMYAAPTRIITKLPLSVDLRRNCPPVYDQRQLGSCIANAIGGAFQFEELKQKKKSFVPTRLFINYKELWNTLLIQTVARKSTMVLKVLIKLVYVLKRFGLTMMAKKNLQKPADNKGYF